MNENALSPDLQARLEIRESSGDLIQAYATDPAKGESRLSLEPGMNEVRWALQYPSAETFEGMVLWSGGTSGPVAVPGTYSAELVVGEQTMKIDFEVIADPSSSALGRGLPAAVRFSHRSPGQADRNPPSDQADTFGSRPNQ